MPETADTQACKDVVFRFCVMINEWERVRDILNRIENEQFVSDLKREAVAGITVDSHIQAHANIFERFIAPRDRKYGSSPGAPLSWCSKGSYFDVDRETIKSVEFPRDRCAEVITEWSYQLPGNDTMFALKRIAGLWLIDNLKVGLDDKWDIAHF